MPLLRLLRVRCDALNESPPDHIRLFVHRDEQDPAMWENYFGEVGQTLSIDREYSFSGTIRLEMIEVDPLINDAIGTVTITAEPTPPDGAVARFAGDDAHYTLRYQVIEATQPSTAGPPPVCEPPPDRSAFPPQPIGSDREASCGGTGRTWVELRYRYANGRGVPHAEYYIARASGEILARGALDANGFVHVEPLPADCYEIRYWFDNDPVEYTISREYRPIRHTWVQSELDLLIANYLQSGVDWFWGAIQGDFNENPGMGQIAFNTILGLIPVVDQALDVRDLTANVILLIGDPAPGQSAGYLRWEVWLAALLCLIGCIPEVGTVVKGVGKAVFRFGASAAAALFRELVEILNRAGIGNAVQWLRQLLGDIPMLVRRAGDELRRVLDELSRVFDRVIARATGVWDNLVSQLRRMKQRIVEALRELPGAVERMIREWVEKLRNAIDGRQRQTGSGSTNTQNGLNQTAGEVPRGNDVPGTATDPEVPGNPGTGRGRRRRNRIEDRGTPGTIAWNGAGTTAKKYGADGWVEKEFNKGHSGGPPVELDDHIHDYVPNPHHPEGRPTRQPARRPRPGERGEFGLDE